MSSESATKQQTINTGFPEPFSELVPPLPSPAVLSLINSPDRTTNTTLRHPAAIPSESLSRNQSQALLATAGITDEKRRRMRFHRNGHGHAAPEHVDTGDMYQGLREHDAESIDGHERSHEHEHKVKRALKRLSCGSVH